jgi:hypothetical protein
MSGETIALDEKTSEFGTIALVEGIAVPLTPEMALTYDGHRYAVHHGDCEAGIPAPQPWIARKPTAPQRLGTAPSTVADALEFEVTRLAVDFVAEVRRRLGTRKIYEWATVNSLFNEFRREKRIAEDVAFRVAAASRREITTTPRPEPRTAA